MDQRQKDLLANKRNQLHRKLYATEFVRRFIEYHWLELFQRIQISGISIIIESLCTVSQEEYPFFYDALAALNHQELSQELIKIAERSIKDELFDKYPSIDAFKYIMDIPVIKPFNQSFTELLRHPNSLPGFNDELIYLFSPDWSPIIRLNWDEVVKNGYLFDDIPQSLIFTNSSMKKILFKSIEDEWRFLDL